MLESMPDFCYNMRINHLLGEEMNMEHYKFFQNGKCEYFPCHHMADAEKFSCLFCYCPLYALGDRCGGNYTYTDAGIKDCSGCLIPHQPENYERMMQKMDLVMKLAAKSRENT